ncbi:MAG: ABC transporter permease [Verrucomicrobia bacterium]|nr:MAG: ABC transporter permease [Verrucomicrobiota bacterium]
MPRIMRWHLKQFFALAWLTALEAIRQPVFLLLMAVTVFFAALLPLITAHTMGEAERMVRDSALALHFVAGLVLGSYLACAALQHEIRRGTVAAILSKPVGRITLFLAKFAGIALVMLFFSAALTITTILSTRAAAPENYVDWWAAGPLLATVPVAFLIAGIINYVTRRPFVSNAFMLLVLALGVALLFSGFFSDTGHVVKWGQPLPWKILPAGALIALAILMLSAFALLLATKLDVVPTLSLCSVIFLLGLMSDNLFGRAAATSKLSAALYGVIPNLQQFWLADALAGDGVIPWAYVGAAALYALCHLVFVLALGMFVFNRIEVRAAA